MGKKIFFSFFLIFVLSGCFWGKENMKISGLLFHQAKDFSLYIPSSWDVLDFENQNIPLPNQGKRELIAMAKTLKNGLRNNILILSDNLNIYMSSKKFSMLNNIGASKDYIDYNKLDAKDIIFTDKEDGILYIFEAKYNVATPKLKFLQTARVCNQKKGYLLTLALDPSIKDTSKYEQFLSTFQCRENS